MTQRTIENFKDKIYSKASKTIYNTNKTIAFCNNNMWSLDILELRDNGPENIRSYRCIFGSNR